MASPTSSSDPPAPSALPIRWARAVTGWEPLIAVVGLALLVHLGMAVRTALALRRVGVPVVRAWTAGLLAWPLVRRAVAGHGDLDRTEDDHGGSPGA
jgi:hypothetical protein